MANRAVVDVGKDDVGRRGVKIVKTETGGLIAHDRDTVKEETQKGKGIDVHGEKYSLQSGAVEIEGEDMEKLTTAPTAAAVATARAACPATTRTTSGPRASAKVAGCS